MVRTATRHGLLGQRQSGSITAFGSDKIFARTIRHVVFRNSLARVDGFQYVERV